MAKSILNEQVENYRKRFQSILEYTQVMGTLNEAEPEEPETMGDAMGGAPDPMGGGADPNAMGGAPDPMGGGADPMGGGTMGDAMGGGADPMGGDAMGGGADPNAMGAGNEAQGVEGLAPQGGEDAMGGEGMPEPGDDMPEEDGDIEEMEEDDEVIDVDQLTGYQQKTAKGVGKISDELRDLKRLITSFEDKVNANNQGIEDLKRELAKRAPDAQERITLRQGKSGPFNQTVEDYWNNNAPDNYSTSSEDVVNEPKYKITKADIDGITDWNSISKSFDAMAEFNDLRNIFGL